MLFNESTNKVCGKILFFNKYIYNFFFLNKQFDL